MLAKTCAAAALLLAVSACDGSPNYRSPTVPPPSNLARLWTGNTTIQSVDELLAQCATPLVTPGARESVAVHVNSNPYVYYFGIAFGARFSPELGLVATFDGQTIRAQAIPVVFYYDDAPYFDCRDGQPLERLWIYGAVFSGVVVEDRIEGTLEILYRTGPSDLDPGTTASSYERLELVRAEP
jgi:hypothetical protein